MSVIIKGMGTNVLTKGFGSISDFIKHVKRELVQLFSEIDTFVNLVSK